MPATPVRKISGALCQHDFEGRRIFQHRSQHKWSLRGDNPRLPDFLFEKECLEYLQELRGQWVGRVRPENGQISAEEKKLAEELTQNLFLYVRAGHDTRPMRFDPDGLVSLGAGGCEVFWDTRRANGKVELDISSDAGRTCSLRKGQDGIWRGAWEVHEKMPVELVPVPPRLLGARPPAKM